MAYPNNPAILGITIQDTIMSCGFAICKQRTVLSHTGQIIWNAILADINEIATFVTYLQVKSLQLIWRSGTQ